MKKLVGVLAILAVWTGQLPAQEDSVEARMLRAQSKMQQQKFDKLKKQLEDADAELTELDEELDAKDKKIETLSGQIEALKKQIASQRDQIASQKKKPKAQPAGGKKQSTVFAQFLKGSGRSKTKAGKSRTFSISDDDPAWWRDPSGLLFEMALRRLIGTRHAEEVPASWLARNKHFKGKQLDWLVRIQAVDTITEEEAGEEYYRIRRDVKSQQQRVKEAKQRLQEQGKPPAEGGGRRDRRDRRAAPPGMPPGMPPGAFPEGMYGPGQGAQSVEDRLKQELAREQRQLDLITAESRKWKRLLDSKGGTILRLSYGGGESRSGSPPISLSVILPLKEAGKLENYQDDVSEKHRGVLRGNPPVHARGKIASLTYDGQAISITLEGTWAKATDGEIANLQQQSQLQPGGMPGGPGGYMGQPVPRPSRSRRTRDRGKDRSRSRNRRDRRNQSRNSRRAVHSPIPLHIPPLER